MTKMDTKVAALIAVLMLFLGLILGHDRSVAGTYIEKVGPNQTFPAGIDCATILSGLQPGEQFVVTSEGEYYVIRKTR